MPKRTYINTRDSAPFRPDYLILLARLGHPHLKLPPVIHVGGTNGKGSTVTFLRAMAEAAGKRVHTYTSPHLVRFNERLIVASTMINDHDLEQLLDEIMSLTAGLEVTFFEVTTAMAFTIFARVPADLCIIEVGMGGRMDCTNVIPAPAAAIITRISYDHTQYLGETLEDIIREKSGILKPGVPCIVGYQQGGLAPGSAPPAMDLLYARARQLDAPLHRAGYEWEVRVNGHDAAQFQLRYDSLLNHYPRPSLLGAHQLQNAGAALACVMALRKSDSLPSHLPSHALDSFSIHHGAQCQGLRAAQWPARLQRLDQQKPAGRLNKWIADGAELWLDGGHNDSAGAALAAQAASWHDTDAKPLHLIIAMKQDKQAAQFLKPILPYAASLTFIPLPTMAAQSHDPLTLAQSTMTLQPGLRVSTAADLAQALQNLPRDQVPARILITGSLFLAGAVLAE